MRNLLILVTYNGFAFTRNCLFCLQNLSSSEWKIVIADNGSSDNTPEKLKEEFPFVEVYELKANKGFGFANNYAFKKANETESFDLVCFLNNDTLLSSETLDVLKNSFNKIQNKVIMAPKVFNSDGSVQRNDYCFLSPWQFFSNAFRSVNKADEILHGKLNTIPSTSFLQNDWMNGVCLMMKASAFEQIGMFDENFFMYYEDTDFAYRAKKLGYVFYMNPESYLTHLGGASAKSSLSQSLQHDSSQYYFYKKHFGLKGVLLSKLFRMVRSGVRILSFSLLGIFKQDKRIKARLHVKLFVNAFRK